MNQQIAELLIRKTVEWCSLYNNVNSVPNSVNNKLRAMIHIKYMDVDKYFWTRGSRDDRFSDWLTTGENLERFLDRVTDINEIKIYYTEPGGVEPVNPLPEAS